MKTVTVPIIRSDEDLKLALRSFDRVFMAKPGTPEADERDVLALVIESYERKCFPIEAPDFVAAIRFAMEQRNLSRETVAAALGGAPRLSEVLSGKRNLSLRQIRALHTELKIPLESLILSPVKPAGLSKAKAKARSVVHVKPGIGTRVKANGAEPSVTVKRPGNRHKHKLL